MQKITPHLWFDKEAVQAAQFYTATFNDSKILNTSVIHDTPSGTVETVTVNLMGMEFMLLSAGPLFKFTPAVSFLVACDSPAEVEALWHKLIDGGSALMELGEYPFSPKYGWLQDKYGLSWQLMFMGGIKSTQKITPTLMYVGEQAGKAQEAVNLYTSVFKNSQIGDIMRYQKAEEPDKEGTIKHATFTLEGQQFAAMDSAHAHHFTFTEAISFIVNCQDQAEIDYYWQKLSADPAAEQCGWLKDKFGVSWQVTPAVLAEMMQDKDPEKVARVTQAFLQMKKFDIAELQKAYQGK